MDAKQIKRDQFEAAQDREAIVLVRSDYGWDVWHWSATGGVAPTSSYDTAPEAAARVCQLLKLREPVVPQGWPEIAQIGGGGGPPPRP